MLVLFTSVCVQHFKIKRTHLNKFELKFWPWYWPSSLIGRILAHTAIVYFGQFLENFRSSSNIGATLLYGNSYDLFLTKNFQHTNNAIKVDCTQQHYYDFLKNLIPWRDSNPGLLSQRRMRRLVIFSQTHPVTQSPVFFKKNMICPRGWSLPLG
jgi:hypothetical protein